MNGKMYAGTNKGLWYSVDGGKSWNKILTGFTDIDDGIYHVVSLAGYGSRLYFTAVIDKPYRGGNPGVGKLLYLDESGNVFEDVSIPVNEEITVSARYPYIFLSSPYHGVYVREEGGSWKRILERATTRIFVDEDYNLYVGTWEDWWYVGKLALSGEAVAGTGMGGMR